jgi:valyl-tRNA synthetase
VQQVSTSGVNVSWVFIAEHSEVKTAVAVEKERERERERKRDRGRETKTAGPGQCSISGEARVP